MKMLVGTASVEHEKKGRAAAITFMNNFLSHIDFVPYVDGYLENGLVKSIIAT